MPTSPYLRISRPLARAGVVLALVLVGHPLTGCGTKSAGSSTDDQEPIPECTEYAKEVHACFEKLGIPDSHTREESVARAATRATSEPQRAHLKSSCARDLASLKNSCR